MYQQIKPTEVFRERELALIKEVENRRLLLGRRMRMRRASKARNTMALAVVGFVGALVVASLLLAASSSPAYAATTPFTVNDPTDFLADDLNPGDGVCDTNLSPTAEECTLRAAIQEANASPGADEIDSKIPDSVFGAGVKTISPSRPCRP